MVRGLQSCIDSTDKQHLFRFTKIKISDCRDLVIVGACKHLE